MRKFIISLSFVLVSTLSLRAQVQDTTELTNTLTAYVMGGYVRNISTFDQPIEGINQNGADFGVRLMVKPGHLLSGGIEIGQSHIYSVEHAVTYEQQTSELISSMYVMPLIFVFSMTPIENVNINLGTGTSFINAEVTSFGNTVTSSTLSPAFMVSANYMKPLSEDFSIGGEVKFQHLGKYNDSNLSFLLSLSYTFFEW